MMCMQADSAVLSACKTATQWLHVLLDISAVMMLLLLLLAGRAGDCRHQDAH